MILFLLFAVQASDRNFFGGNDNQEYCIMCGDEFQTIQMTYCIHLGIKEIIHYMWCKDCASDEQVQEKFEETCRGGLEMDEGVSILMIECPLCRQRGKYNDDVLKEGNENVNVEMQENNDDSPFSMNDQMNQQQNNNIALQNEQNDQDFFENQMEQAKRMSIDSLNKHQQELQEANEWNDQQFQQAMEESRLLYEVEMKNCREQYMRQCEKVDIRGHKGSPKRFYGHRKPKNELNSPRSSLNTSILGKKNIIKKRDRSTAHVMMTSTYMALLFSVWIACMPGAHIDHTVDKMGYLLQQFARTYLGFIGFFGLGYTIFSKEKAWHYKHRKGSICSTNCSQRDADANRSLLMYLASVMSTILTVVGCIARFKNISYADKLVQYTSWFTMLFGFLHFLALFFQKCLKCNDSCQRSSCVEIVNDKFFKSLQKQPQEFIRQKLGMSQVRWRTKPVVGIKGNLTGFFSSFIPFFGLLQAFFFFVHKNELTGEQFNDNELLANTGLALGIFFTLYFQRIRWKADIGVLTGEQALTGLIAWFMAYHSDPKTAIYAIISQIIFLGIYVLHKCYFNLRQ